MDYNFKVMTSKKNEKANIERTRSSFFLLGVSIVLGLILISFEWTTTGSKTNVFLDQTQDGFVEEIIPNIDLTEPVIPPQVPIQDFFEIVDNDNPVLTDLIIFGGETSIDEPIPPIWFRPSGVDSVVKEDDIFVEVKEMPKFRGGDLNKFSDWVNERVKYPQIAIDNLIQGKVIVGFVVEPDGSLSNITVLRKVDENLEKEVLRVVSSSPKWSPGKQWDVPVRVRLSIAVNFKLE